MTLLILAAVHAEATKLSSLVDCHEALQDKVDASTTKLDLNHPTPIVVQKGSELFIYTQKSVYRQSISAEARVIVLKIEDSQGVLYRKISINKKKQIEHVSFENLSASEKTQALTPRSALDEGSLALLTTELRRQIASMSGEYQNKYSPAETMKAIESCLSIKDEQLRANAQKQISFYQKFLNKNRYNKRKSGSR